MQLAIGSVFAVLSVLGGTAAQGDLYAQPIVVEKPSCITMDLFQSTFEKICPLWEPKPVNDVGFYYENTTFMLGDKSGSNTDTQATVQCRYYTSRQAVKNSANEIVPALGGTIIA
ncbi:hypothetical protein V865_004490 [Kwoniella europaea PYCC6329]|uniref:Uncharacterized protein n=1 Tax=Kwoniella europaea PYCC6329 TaxID=1423913 RepID=A0AAX4KLB7_9TREE